MNDDHCQATECRVHVAFNQGTAFGLSFATSLIEGASNPAEVALAIARIRELVPVYAKGTTCLAPGWQGHPFAEEEAMSNDREEYEERVRA